MISLKKLNRGAVLILAAILGVVIYLIINAAATAVEAGRIKTACADFIAVEAAYTLLPAEYRQEPAGMTADEQEQYIADMAEALKPLLAEGGTADQKLLEMEETLRLQMAGTGVIIDFKKNIVRFGAININQGVAVVTVTTENTYDGPAFDAFGGASDRSRLVEASTDTLVLQRIDGVWKIYSSALYNPWPYAAGNGGGYFG